LAVCRGTQAVGSEGLFTRQGTYKKTDVATDQVGPYSGQPSQQQFHGRSTPKLAACSGYVANIWLCCDLTQRSSPICPNRRHHGHLIGGARLSRIAVVKLAPDFLSGKVERHITGANPMTTMARVGSYIYAVTAGFGFLPATQPKLVVRFPMN
jgi:hypothetical protein